MSLQGRDVSILISQNKIIALIKKFNMWKTRINDVVDAFPGLCGYIASKTLIKAEVIFSDIQQHLELFSKHFTKYLLKEANNNFYWILNPFVVA